MKLWSALCLLILIFCQHSIFGTDKPKTWVFNPSFGSSDSEDFSQQILGFIGQVDGQRPSTNQKSTRDARKISEAEGERAQTWVFTYSPQELAKINELDSSYRMSKDQLRKWDLIAMRAVEERKLNFYEFSRLFTYLYVAQAEALSLSQSIKKEPVGSLDPLSAKVLTLFIKDLTLPSLFQEDAYSKALSEIIFSKIKNRIEQENSLHRQITVPQKYNKIFSAGVIVANWIPWCATPSVDYWPPPLPEANDPEWRAQIQSIARLQTPMTEEKKNIIYRWAGLAYPLSDDWRSIVNEFLFCHDVSLQKMSAVRAATEMGLYDAIIAYIGCKYHYLAIRPKMRDPEVQYIIAVPLHPSYPAGHSTESTVTAEIMSAFFPSDCKYWQTLAEQCCISRIWAGVHYPIDDVGGRICGQKVAKTILNCIPYNY